MNDLQKNQHIEDDDPLLVAAVRLEMDILSACADKAVQGRTDTGYLLLLALADTSRQLISELYEKSSELKQEMDVCERRVDAFFAYGRADRLVRSGPLRKQ